MTHICSLAPHAGLAAEDERNRRLVSDTLQNVDVVEGRPLLVQRVKVVEAVHTPNGAVALVCGVDERGACEPRMNNGLGVEISAEVNPDLHGEEHLFER